jgi:hypothetical protein
MKYRSRKRYGHGGNIDDKKAMILSQIKEVHHHADELAEVVAKMDTVDAWVVGKMERATTDLSDITHYLDGTTEYAKGGMMSDNTFDNILMHYGFKKTKTFSGKRFFSNGKNKEIFASVDDKLKEVRVETNDVTIYSGYSIFDLMYILNRNRNLFLADGGMMAKGGMTKNDFDVIVRTPKGLVTKKDFDGFTKEEIIKWCEDRGWVYNPKGEKFGGSILKEYEFFIKVPTKAKGGNVSIKEGDRVIYKGEERTVYSLYPKGMASLCYIDKDGYEYEVVEDKKLKVPIKDLTLIPPVKPSKGDIKEGDKVIYEGEKRTVYALYPKGMASLCLIDEDGYEYKDVEEDYQVSIKDLTPVKGSTKHNVILPKNKMAKGGEVKKAVWHLQTIGKTPENDEGYWENYQYATSEDLEPTSGRYRGYKWVLMTNIQEPEGYWEKKEMAKGGEVISKTRRFTDYDFKKLTEDDFYGTWNSGGKLNYWLIKTEKGNQEVAKFYPSKEKLELLKVHNGFNLDIIIWLHENSFLSNDEYFSVEKILPKKN